jgi:hypothetical protein
MKRPRDFSQRAKHIVQLAVGEAVDESPKNSAAAERGRKGGAARAAKLTPEQKSEIGKRGARARWKLPRSMKRPT